MIFVLIGLLASAQPEWPSPTLTCPERWGEPAAPLVSRADTAISIYLAVERDFFPRADAVNFPEIEIEDEGNHWTVWRSAPVVENPDGSITITSGGGQLTMSIAKCDGAVSDVHLTR